VKQLEEALEKLIDMHECYFLIAYNLEKVSDDLHELLKSFLSILIIILWILKKTLELRHDWNHSQHTLAISKLPKMYFLAPCSTVRR